MDGDAMVALGRRRVVGAGESGGWNPPPPVSPGEGDAKSTVFQGGFPESGR